MADVRQYRQDPQINHGTTAQSNLKLTDVMPVQHENLATQTNSINKINLAQCLCEPYALCNSNNPSNGQYTATCENFPDFALSYTDSQGTSHNLIGLKVRVKFTYGVTYGSTTSNPPTYPTLNINGSGAIPMLAQGKTMGKGAISAEQTVEFTIIPYGNGLAFDADSNVRESTSDYTIYTDGWKIGDKLFCTINRLWSGTISDEDNHNLLDSIQNYTFLIVQMVTNQEYDYMLLPVSSILLNQTFARTMMANNTTEVTLPFSYQSTCIFKFPSNTTIQNKSLYNNINYKLKICNVWGIK